MDGVCLHIIGTILEGPLHIVTKLPMVLGGCVCQHGVLPLVANLHPQLMVYMLVLPGVPGPVRIDGVGDYPVDESPLAGGWGGDGGALVYLASALHGLVRGSTHCCTISWVPAAAS